MVHPYGSKPFFFNGSEVPPAPLHVKDRFLLAQQVFLANLDRRVPPAVHHQRLVPAQQPGGIHPQAQVSRPFGELRRLRVIPETFHTVFLSVYPLVSAGSIRQPSGSPGVSALEGLTASQ